MQSYMALKRNNEGVAELAIVAKDYSVDEDGVTKIDEEVGSIFISRCDGDQIFIQVTLIDESVTGPVTFRVV